MEYQVNANFLV